MNNEEIQVIRNLETAVIQIGKDLIKLINKMEVINQRISRLEQPKDTPIISERFNAMFGDESSGRSSN